MDIFVSMQLNKNQLLLIAGPCLAESRDLLMTVAEKLSDIAQNRPVQLIFKASYRKANRTSSGAFSGIGDEKALGFMQEVKNQFGLPLLTDIHTDEEAAMAAETVDVIQIPAFLARQTSLLHAAAQTGKVVNIKKGQFMAPEDVVKASKKVLDHGNPNVWLTERGTSFGYHDLVVDFRGMVIMQQSGLPVIFDATHSVQRPSVGAQSGGAPEFIEPLAKAAMAVGVRGLFVETHPDPANAKSDAATQLPLVQFETFIDRVLEHWSPAK